MPLLAVGSAQNSMRSAKSWYEFLESKNPPLPLSPTIAPPSARQLTSPTRSKFSRPFSPSISVVQPLPGIHEGIDEQAESRIAAVATIRRFMGTPPLRESVAR